jgi:hypothetical protein
MPLSASQSVFSVFVEQMNNMMMYSAEEEILHRGEDKLIKAPKGIFILGTVESTYFVQTGNVMKTTNVNMLKERIDNLNQMDKQELRKFYRQKIKEEDNNPESKGAGIGLIEIARRATSKIEYEFTPYGEEYAYFTLYVTI